MNEIMIMKVKKLTMYYHIGLAPPLTIVVAFCNPLGHPIDGTTWWPRGLIIQLSDCRLGSLGQMVRSIAISEAAFAAF